MLRETIEKELLDNCIPEPNSGCWIWLGRMNSGSTPVLSLNCKNFNSRNLAFECWVGPLEDGDTARVSCGCSYCINPDHLIGHKKYASYSMDECIEIASNYSTVREMSRDFGSGLYRIIKQNGWEKLAFSHMDFANDKTTKEFCRREAIKYLTRTQFSKGSNGAYQRAANNGWLNEICDHMKTLRVCVSCGKEFESSNIRQANCSKKCGARHYQLLRRKEMRRG